MLYYSGVSGMHLLRHGMFCDEASDASGAGKEEGEGNEGDDDDFDDGDRSLSTMGIEAFSPTPATSLIEVRRNGERRAMTQRRRFPTDLGTETTLPRPPKSSNTAENNGSSADAPQR